MGVSVMGANKGGGQRGAGGGAGRRNCAALLMGVACLRSSTACDSRRIRSTCSTYKLPAPLSGSTSEIRSGLRSRKLHLMPIASSLQLD